MADTIRTCSYLQNVFRDGQADGSITPQDVRDLVVSAMLVATGISAAGTTQATATALSSYHNIVNTVASGAGVVLPPGVTTVVHNRGVSSLAVYPPTGAKIEQLSTNTALSVAPGQGAMFVFDPSNGTQIYVISWLNFATLGTTLPSAAGIPWLDGGVVSVS